MVCCDANLGVVGGHDVTHELNNLLSLIKPTSVALFTSTPECTPNAQSYLNGILREDTLQLPAEVTRGFVADRRELTGMILNNQPLPQLIRTTHNIEKKLQKEVSSTTLTTSSREINEALNFPAIDIVSHKNKSISFSNMYKLLKMSLKNNVKVAPLDSSSSEEQRPPNDNKPKPGH